MEMTHPSGLAVITKRAEILDTFSLPPVQPWAGWPEEWATPLWGSIVGWDTIMSRVSTVWSCIDRNGSILSTMPPYVVTGSTPIKPPAWVLNPQPEIYTGWTEFFQQVFTAYMLGEAFIWCTGRYESGWPARFVMLRPDWVNIEWEKGLRRYFLGGGDITKDVLHIRYASWPGDAHGHGPLEAGARNLVGAEGLERYASDLSRRGGIPWAVLKHPMNLSAEQATDLAAKFVAARASTIGAPAVLSGALELQPLTFNPKDMALLELRQFEESRLAILLGMVPFLVGLPSGGDSMTYSNVSALFDYHWRAFLRPFASKLMEAFSGWALPRGTRLELNRDEYTRPPFAERVAAYAQLFGIVDEETGQRAIGVDEIRALERLGGDVAGVLSGAS